MCIYCKERCFLFSDIILINSNPNSKHLQNRNFVYINEREVVQNVKITCAASDIDHKCIWSMRVVSVVSYFYWTRLKAAYRLLLPSVDTGFMCERNITENDTHTII